MIKSNGAIMHAAHAKGSASSSGQECSVPVGSKFVLDEKGFSELLTILVKVGYDLIGPQVRDGAVVYEPIEKVEDLPIGVSDEQEGGHYRLVEGTKGAYFQYVVGPSSWKKYLFPSRQKLWAAEKKGKKFTVLPSDEQVPTYAFLGVRPCELAAIEIQDKVFGYGREKDVKAGVYPDPAYAARREQALIIVVNCSRAAKTCFCDSMGTGPRVSAERSYDLAMTEVMEGTRHEFVLEVGSKRGALIAELLPKKKASDLDVYAAEKVSNRARSQISRKMVADAEGVLKRNLEHPRWDEVATRCLTCANCTMACPTCFCHTVEEVTDLSGEHAERWKMWDSCFSVDFSYIHGGAIRREAKSRYRQWMTHKLAHWHDQFGEAGCVGCGRCITWCPVGIDITEEAKAIKYSGK